jgi:lipoprotein-anchoring transpeptidase ErfK/SrfK
MNPRRPRPEHGRVTASTLVVGVLLAGLVAWGADALGRSEEPPPPDLASLVASSTTTTLDGAPTDPHPRKATAGIVVHPKRVVALRSAPAGEAFGKIGPRQFGETWLPVVEESRGWVRVLLPSRPNGSTGWMPSGALERRRTPYLLRVHTGSRELEILRDGERLGTWQVAVGKKATPTPTGRTFVLGSILDPRQSSSVILPLGSHSETLDSYGGGPGTVAFHTWSDPSVFGTAASHGCVRVPRDALDLLAQVPLGTVVLIDSQ